MQLLVFFEVMFIYASQSTMLPHTHDDAIRMDKCLSRMFFHHAALYSFVFSFHSLLDTRKENAYVCVCVFLLYCHARKRLQEK